MCLLALEDRSDEEVLDEMRLARDCGVPLTLREIAELDDAELALIVRESVHAPDMENMSVEVTEARLLAAMQRIEGLADRV